MTDSRSVEKKCPPRIGITIGDVAGIGAEISLKAITDQSILEICLPVLIGDANFLFKSADDLGLKIDFEVIKKGEEIPSNSAKPIIYDLANLTQPIELGKESGIAGKAAGEYIETAVGLCLENKIEAITTAPINKKSLAMGGYNFPGHTEMLAKLTNTHDFAMSFFAEKLRVVLLSTHVSLLEAIDLVKKDKLVDLIKFTYKELTKLLKKDVKIAVAGLNPHASEDGIFGNQEALEITPAIEECQKEFGINVTGAYSPDTIFLRAYRGEFDAVVACYHDQATIAVKCLSFGESVNVTLGLPIIRTSVDHGTAFEIAGKNIADCSSMKTAIKLAATLALDS
ncbi:MAG TPA: 4-hydroxythreonine-4-phosphate dehydrogenase PdxA [Pyrinomonadaceae bacterium]|nr:4-hydroxythreonine-4-phosphate dehydrogenase PdxA [Pyrinomonadaceae bacterium]